MQNRSDETPKNKKLNIMFNSDEFTGEKTQECNLHWPQIPDHPYRILIVGDSGSGKIYALLNLRKHRPDTDKIYLYAKDPFEAKYQLLINKQQDVLLKHFKDSKTFIKYSDDTENVCKSIKEYNPGKKIKV